MRAFWASLVIVFGLVGLAIGQVPNTLYSVITNAVSVSFPFTGTEKFVITQGGDVHNITSTQLISLLTTTGQSVATNAALLLTPTTAYPSGVWRTDFSTGANASPLFYLPSSVACPLNGGNGDNGSQVKSADSKCWLAAFPETGISPMQFGTVGDGHANDTAAVQAAMNAAAESTLQLGRRIYAVDTITCNNMVKVVGAEAGQSGEGSIATNRSGFIPRATNQTLFTVAEGCFGSSFEDFYIGMSTPGVNTAGWAFQTAVPIGNLRFSRLQIVGACGGIDISGYFWIIDKIQFNEMSGPACSGIRIGHLTTGSATTGRISNVSISSVNTASRLGVGMLIEDMGGGSIEQNDIVYPNRGTFINPGANQEINWAFIHDTVLGDTTGDVGFAIDTAAASAAVRGIQCNGCWVASSQNSDGILIANTGASPTVEGLHFLGARIYRNAGHGVAISGGTYIDFEASHICGNNLIAGANTGIAIENGINNVRVRGGEVGGGCDGQASTQAAGIYFVGTSTNTQIQGVDLSNNNTIPIAFGGVVTGRIEGNPGYNPVGAAAIGSPPASGNPYTAGASPETIYLSASGGVSAVTQNGTGVLPAALGNNIVATFDLGPGEILTPTYGGAITMKKMVH